MLRLPYQGSAGRWLIAIYRASSESWSESELPTRFGPAIGTRRITGGRSCPAWTR